MLSAIPCEAGHCKGYNAKNNVRIVGPGLYNQLLSNPPHGERELVEELRAGILKVKFTAQEILTQLEELLKSAGEQRSKFSMGRQRY